MKRIRLIVDFPVLITLNYRDGRFSHEIIILFSGCDDGGQSALTYKLQYWYYTIAYHVEVAAHL